MPSLRRLIESLTTLRITLTLPAGPSIGGALSQPCQHYGSLPLCGPGELLERRPYFLPCFTAGVMCFVAFLLSIFMLEETLPSMVAQRATLRPPPFGISTPGKAGYQRVSSGSSLSDNPGSSSSSWWQQWVQTLRRSPLGSRVFASEARAGSHFQYYKPLRTDTVAIQFDIDVEAVHGAGPGFQDTYSDAGKTDCAPADGTRASAAKLGSQVEMSHLTSGPEPNQTSSCVPAANGAGANADAKGEEKAHLLTSQGSDRPHPASTANPVASTAAAGAAAAAGQEGCSDEAPPLPWHKDKQVLLAIAGYGFTALVFAAFDETTPIFASAPIDEGGLDMEEVQLAGPLAFGGFILMLWSVWGYPKMQKRYGTLKVAFIGHFASVGVCFLVPSSSLVVRSSPAAAHGVLYFAMFWRAFATCNAFTSSLIMVNVVAHPTQLGAVNGVGQTIASFVRGLGPAVVGLLWSLFLTVPLPGRQFLTFAVVSLSSLGACWVYRHVSIPGLQ